MKQHSSRSAALPPNHIIFLRDCRLRIGARSIRSAQPCFPGVLKSLVLKFTSGFVGCPPFHQPNVSDDSHRPLARSCVAETRIDVRRCCSTACSRTGAAIDAVLLIFRLQRSHLRPWRRQWLQSRRIPLCHAADRGDQTVQIDDAILGLNANGNRTLQLRISIQ